MADRERAEHQRLAQRPAAARCALPWTSLTLCVTQASQTCSASSMVRPWECRIVVPGTASSRPPAAPRRAEGRARRAVAAQLRGRRGCPRVVVGLASDPVDVDQVPEPGASGSGAMSPPRG